MSIINGYKKFKKYIKTDNNIYKLLSQWTSSDTVEMSNGETLEDTVLVINNKINTKSDIGVIPVDPENTDTMNIWIES